MNIEGQKSLKVEDIKGLTQNELIKVYASDNTNLSALPRDVLDHFNMTMKKLAKNSGGKLN